MQPSHAMRTVLLLIVLVLGCGPGGAPSPGGTGGAATGSPESAVWPPRGAAAANAEAPRRRPIVVRVGNEEAARPAADLSNADLVMEVMVEGGITRLAVVFHSQDADRVGPVRSARLSDVHYATSALRRHLVAAGNGHVPLRELDWQDDPAQARAHLDAHRPDQLRSWDLETARRA